MARPPNPRRIGLGFATRVFKPAGAPMHRLTVVRLDLDGLEALRLADLEGLYQEAAAERMGVSRATFGRILTTAHARVAEALLAGKALWIGGGPVLEGAAEALPCPVHGGGRRRGRGCRCAGRTAGFAAARVKCETELAAPEPGDEAPASAPPAAGER